MTICKNFPEKKHHFFGHCPKQINLDTFFHQEKNVQIVDRLLKLILNFFYFWGWKGVSFGRSSLCAADLSPPHLQKFAKRKQTSLTACKNFVWMPFCKSSMCKKVISYDYFQKPCLAAISPPLISIPVTRVSSV